MSNQNRFVDGEKTNESNCFVTKIYLDSPFPPKFIIEWHDRLHPFFGSISFTIEDYKVIIDSECKNKDFVKSILNCVVDGAELIGEE